MTDVRIWFSGIWASRAHVIRILRDNPDGVGVRIFGTHADPWAAALGACDVAGREPDTDDERYLEFALDFCRRHRIDAVLPSERLGMFSAAVDAFAGHGTRVMCSPSPAITALSRKSSEYAAAGRGGAPLAPWWAVSDPEALLAAAAQVRAQGGTACLKPAGEFSAPGFRILDDSPPEVCDLLARARPALPAQAAAEALRRAAERGGAVPEFIVMPYLEPPEISVDCLSAPGGRLLAAVVRLKEGKVRLLAEHPEAVEIARRLVGQFGLAYLSNVQLRHWRGRPVLLEVNPRTSDGIYQTRFTGLNLPWAAVRLLLRGDPGELSQPRLGRRLVVVNTAVPVAAAGQV